MEPQIKEKSDFDKPTIISTKGSENEKPPDPFVSHVTFEDLLEKLGCFGPFQVLTLCSYLLLEIASAFMAFIPILVGRTITPTNCTEPGEYENFTSTTTADFLHSIVESENPEIKSLFGNIHQLLESPFKYESIVEEWDLKCERAWVPDAFTSCLMAGMIVGNLGASQAADWYGRRKSYLLVLVFMAIGTLLSAISPSIYFYAFARFVSGAAFCGFINISCMAVLEFMTPKYRSIANCVGPLGEGIMLLSLFGYFIRPWRLLYLATLAPYLLIIPIYIYLPEGPRWLIRNNRMKEAHEVMNYMAKVNKREPIPMTVLETLRRQEMSETESQKQKRISYLDFIKNRSLLVTSLYLFAIWFVWNISYYGISYNIRNVGGDPYSNLALIGLANAIGQRSSIVVCDWYGRRKAVLFSMSFSASFLVTLAICFVTMNQVSHYIILVGCFFGLLGLACCRASARLLSGESFPTSVRTMGLGVGGLGANVAGLITPQMAFIGSKWPALPFFVFATISVLGSLVVFMMKETNGNPLSDDVQITQKEKKEERV